MARPAGAPAAAKGPRMTAEYTPPPGYRSSVELDYDASSNGAGTHEPPLSIVTAEEFAAIEEPGASSLVGEPGQALIPEGGDIMLYGDGGASKTTLGIDLGCHGAGGVDWLGFPIGRELCVLII